MQVLFSLRRHGFAAFLGIALVLGGCGGGGGGAGPVFGWNPAGGGQEPPPPVEEAVDSEARFAAMDRVDLEFEKITGGRPTATSAEWEQLRDWARAQPEFADAGVGEYSFWARFKDGRHYLLTDNWRVPAGMAPESLPESLKKMGLTNATLDEPTGSVIKSVPASAKAALFIHSGAPAPNPNEFRFAPPLMRDMKEALTERGYAVTRNMLNVENLKQMGDVGFLFFNSHSAMYGPDPKAQEFAVMLDDNATVLNDVVYRADLNAGNLIYHRVRTLAQTLGKGNPPKLAFTSKFVTQYLNFAPNSLVITFSCNSGNAQSMGFRGALKAKGAGTIVGWDGLSSPNGYPAIRLLVDRMAGVNKFEPTAMPNRSFVFADVMKYLGQRGLLTSDGVEDDSGHITPNAFLKTDGSGFTKLAPVITHLEMKADNLLAVHGDFGAEPGEVSVGGVPVNAVWGSTEVKALLANATHGDVVVTAKNLKSNPRQLGSWQGRVTYQSKRVDPSCAGATFIADVDVDLHLRADMQARRTEVDGPLKNNHSVIVPANDTKGQWAASGKCIQGGKVVQGHSGSGALAMHPFVDYDDVAPFSDIVYARLNAVEKRFHVGSTFGKSQMTVQTDDTSKQEGLQIWYQLSDYFYDGSPSWPQDERFPHAFYLPLDAKLNAGQGQTDNQGPSGSGMSLKFQWGAMQVSPELKDTVGH